MRRMILAGGCVFSAILSSSLTFADVIHLREGGKLDGEIIEDLGEVYRIRTVMGISDVEKARVIRIERGDPPWRRYEKEKKKHADTPAGNMAMADWCRKNDMRVEEQRHLQRVIELDPNHADARARLGFVKEGGRWVQPKSSKTPTPEQLTEQRRARANDKRVQDKITEYTVKVKAVYRGRLSQKAGGEGSKSFSEGSRIIMELKDPLAIPAIASVLSGGTTAARKLMIEALSQFKEDEATMNLLAAAILDPSKDVRTLAARALLPRKDDRIISELRAALRSDEEPILRNAAAALGVLKARSAVRDLVPVLSTETVGFVRVSRWVSLDGLYGTFAGEQRYRLGGFPVLYKPSCIWSMGPGSIVGTQSDYEFQVVSIHRTEVQEALIQITGQNLGFNGTAWLKWAEDNGG